MELPQVWVTCRCNRSRAATARSRAQPRTTFSRQKGSGAAASRRPYPPARGKRDRGAPSSFPRAHPPQRPQPRARRGRYREAAAHGLYLMMVMNCVMVSSSGTRNLVLSNRGRYFSFWYLSTITCLNKSYLEAPATFCSPPSKILKAEARSLRPQSSELPGSLWGTWP